MSGKEEFAKDCPYVARSCNSWCRAYVEPNGKIPGFCLRLQEEKNRSDYINEIANRLYVLNRG